MFIARILISLLIASFIFSGTILYTFNKTKVYQASGTLLLLVDRPNAQSHDISPAERDSQNEHTIKDYNTEVNILQSLKIVRGVAQRMSEDELQWFMAPYQYTDHMGPLTPEEVLIHNRTIIPNRSWLVRVNYQHPDPAIAARISNLLMEEYINYQLSEAIDAAMSTVEGLRIRADQQRERVEELSEKYNEILDKQRANRMSIKNSDLELLKMDVDIQQELLAQLLAKMTATKTNISLHEPNARIVDQAFPPLRHHSPNIPLNLAKGSIWSLGLGMGFFLLTGLVFPKRKAG